MSVLPPILYKATVTDRQSGLVTRPWVQWLQALDTRVGGPSAPTILELAAGDAALTGRVTTLEADLAALTLRVAALEAAAALHLGTPTVAAVDAGAGTGAVVSVSGSDQAGVLTLTTADRVARRSHSDVLHVTFAAPYTTAPIVQVQPGNAAAWALAFGRFTPHPCSVRLTQAGVTTTTFTLSVGVTSLPRAGETYTFTYVCTGA